VQANFQGWQRAGAFHRVGDSAFTHHQARTRQDPVAMRGLDCLVYGNVEAEVISRENDPFQDAIC
jgi:hypothetical protein